MSFLMPPIYPRRVSVSRRAVEQVMREDDKVDASAGGCCAGGHAHHRSHAAQAHHMHRAEPNTGVLDPVCGMTVDPATSKHRFDHHGEAFHFCSAAARTKLAANPESYLGEVKPKADVPEGTIYTCPMHPEIR